jgi:hypothetical protein
MRARAETKKAPAEPTTARIAVGFSGDEAQVPPGPSSTDPPCAWSGRAEERRRRVMPSIKSRKFFIVFLVAKVSVPKWEVNARTDRLANTFGEYERFLISIRRRGKTE